MINKSNIGCKLSKLYNSGALHITIGTFATKFVAFFGSIVVVRLLSKSDYGVMSYVENIYSYAFIFAGLGLSNGLLRYLVLTENGEEKKQYYDYIIKRSMLFDIAIAVIMCLLSIFMKIPDKYASARYLIPVVALLLPFQDLLNEELFTVRSFFKNKLYALLAFVSSILLIGGRIVGAIVDGVSGVLWSRVLINAVFAVLMAVFVTKKLFPKERVKSLEIENRKLVNSYSFQYMITNGLWAIFMLNDTFFLGLLLNDPDSLADYKVAYVLPGNISIFATAIGVFVAPYFTKNENNTDWIKIKFRKVLGLSVLAVGTVAVLIGLLAEVLIKVMYGEQYLNTVGLMRVLLVAAFLNSGIRFTIANILAAMGQVRFNMIVSGCGICLQVVLDMILIPKVGVIGVAISNCVVYLLMSLALFTVFVKKYYFTLKK